MTPFGFERNIEAEYRTETEKNINKNFVHVNVQFMTDGTIIPLSFKWNGRDYPIDKVLNCRSGSSLKSPVGGLRYECVILGKRFYLFYTGEKWYLDLK